MTTEPQLKRIASGREAEIYEWERGSVLRLFREERDPIAITREAAAMRAVRDVLPLVPEVLGEARALGRPGLILERIDGLDLLTRIDKQPWTIWNAGTVSGRVHSQLHDIIAPDVLPSLRDRITRLLQQAIVPPHISAYVAGILATLPDGEQLCHGDFHPGNILLGAGGPMVIDWPNATSGDATADVARTLLMTRLAALPPGTSALIRAGDRVGRPLLRIAYMRAYERHRRIDRALLPRWTTVRAADRLAEDIPEERPALLALLEAEMSAVSASVRGK